MTGIADWPPIIESVTMEVTVLLAFAAGGTGVLWYGCDRLEDAANDLAAAYGLPAVVQRAVIAAVGSSQPDAFGSIAAAQADRSTVTLTNVLGSNTFDHLICVPVWILVVGSLTVTFAHIVPMMRFLVLTTLVFFGISRTEIHSTRREAWTLLGQYGAFVCWLILESLRVASAVEL